MSVVVSSIVVWKTDENLDIALVQDYHGLLTEEETAEIKTAASAVNKC